MTEKPNSVCKHKSREEAIACSKYRRMRDVPDFAAEYFHGSEHFEPVAEPAEPSASPLKSTLSSGSVYDPLDPPRHYDQEEENRKIDRMARKEDLYQPAAPQPVAPLVQPHLNAAGNYAQPVGEGPKGWVSEPDWPKEPRNSSYQAGMRDAQNAFRAWYRKVKTFEATRAPEGTPKLEEVVHQLAETVLLTHREPNESIFDYQPRVETAIAAILRPFITPACSPPEFECASRKQSSIGGNYPADCDWPFCGCDPKARKVLEAVEESGFEILPRKATPPSTPPNVIEAAQECLKFMDRKPEVFGLAIIDNGTNNRMEELRKALATPARTGERDAVTKDLKLCPFCGAAAKMQEAEDAANYIECTKCGASTNLQYSLKEDGRPDLIERWNKRTEVSTGEAQPFKLPNELLGGAVKVVRPTDLRNRVGMYMLEEKGVKIGRNVDSGDVQDMIVEFTQREIEKLSTGEANGVDLETVTVIRDGKPVKKQRDADLIIPPKPPKRTPENDYEHPQHKECCPDLQAGNKCSHNKRPWKKA